MSARELGVVSDAPCTVNQEGDGGLIPQQLKEVIELVSSTNQRIEDCAVEWQAKISQAQWRILDAKPVDHKPWEQSVLARTYFAEKTLDDAFQGLLKHNKTFNDHLKNFLALVRGEPPTMSGTETCNAQNQCSEIGLGGEERILPQSSLSQELNSASSAEENPDGRRGRKNLNQVLTKARQSFTNLIKAKIDFDTKFLGFEATLNGTVCTISDPSLCLCQICSKFLGCGMQTTAQNGPKNPKNAQLCKKRTRCSTRIKQKRLKLRKSTVSTRGRKKSEKIVKNSLLEDPSSLNDHSVPVTAGDM